MPFSRANNLQINNLNLLERDTLIGYQLFEFDISWENSWRLAGAPGNYDAVWVFVKYRLADGLWRHATLNTDAAFHTAPAGAYIDPASDGKGIFVYRTEIGTGKLDFKRMKLRWQYAADGVANQEYAKLQVFGIEMVYIPASRFYLGDGDGADYSLAAFRSDQFMPVLVNENNANLIQVTENNYDDAVLENGLWIHGNEGLDVNGDGTYEHPHYPTGFRAFYAMKYEISQWQYVSFLNTLTRNQQQSRTQTDISGEYIHNRFVMSNTPNPEARNGIACNRDGNRTDRPVEFFCDLNANGTGNEENDGLFLACNYLNWADGAAYADWAALRPLTETEFEKMARGPLVPKPGQYAWGNDSIADAPYSLIDAGTAIELGQINPTMGNACYSYTVGAQPGPVRCGFFSRNGSTRRSSGASYYGVMELSGNVRERTVSLGNARGRSFMGTHGDGYLTGTEGFAGNATNADWPGMDADTARGVTNAIGSGMRGGDWNTLDVELRISYRQHGAFSFNSRINSYGFRGGRSAQ